MQSLRAIDHIVLAVSGLDAARARLGQLGFTVAPDAQHPFGTENACVFLADGTYLEPLGVASRETIEETARQGNVFTARDQAYRFRQGPEGMEALVFASYDAKADDAAFAAAGLSAGKILEFSRPFKLPDGTESEASFRLAFAADLRSPDFYAFTCQRINVPKADRSALTAHGNGVTGLAGVTLVEPNPSDFQYFLETVCGQRDVRAMSFGMALEAANATISVLTPEGFERFYDRKHCGHARGLRGRVVSFKVRSRMETAALLVRNGIEHETIGARLVVPQAAGQGVHFSFEELA